jgi:hypothetical protein
MIGTKITGKLAAGALAVAIVAGVCGAGSDTAFALPTTWVLQGAELDDGRTVSGKFTIGPYGYLIAPVAVTTTGGTLLGGFSYAPPDPSDIVPNAPPAFGVDFFSPSDRTRSFWPHRMSVRLLPAPGRTPAIPARTPAFSPPARSSQHPSRPVSACLPLASEPSG